MNWANWESATQCSGGARPGAQAMLRWCLERTPVAWSGGIYNCRPVRGTSTRSIHAEGRAIDVMLPVTNGKAHGDGHALLSEIGDHGSALGVQCVIWDRRVYSKRSPGGREYRGVNPHIDHLHIELTRRAGDTLSYDQIVAVTGGKPKPPVPRLLRLRRPRMRGADVALVQRNLGIKTDGIFGPRTDAAVRHFQRQNGLVADGIVGPMTLVEMGEF